MFQQIINFFQNIDPVLGALYATLFTWGMTALGASFVFLFKTMNRVFRWNVRFYWRGYGSC